MTKEYIERDRAVKALVTDYAYAAADLVSKLPKADVVEVVRCTDEIRKAMDVLNFYRNCHHSASSNTEEYDLADAINTILPRFYKCLDDAKTERSVDNG